MLDPTAKRKVTLKGLMPKKRFTKFGAPEQELMVRVQRKVNDATSSWKSYLLLGLLTVLVLSLVPQLLEEHSQVVSELSKLGENIPKEPNNAVVANGNEPENPEKKSPESNNVQPLIDPCP